MDKKAQKKEYEKLKAIRLKQQRGERLTFAERNILYIVAKKKRQATANRQHHEQAYQ